MRKFWCITAFLCLTALPAALAWSSKWYPPCEEVHQVAIEIVLSNQVPPNLIALLQDQQDLVDAEQQATNSFKHSMTGITNSDDTKAKEMTNYILAAEVFIHSNLTAAISARKSGNTNLAFGCLGQALHPLEDATSPAHSPFQTWSDSEGWWAEYQHVSQEYQYPDNPRSTNEVNERNELEGSVQYAYDIFMETNSMPVNFYNHSNGLLELPDCYLHKYPLPANDP